jgi:hypothetical protein
MRAVAFGRARPGIAGSAEVVDRLLEVVAERLGPVTFLQLEPGSGDVVSGPVSKDAARRVRIVAEQDEALRPVGRAFPAQGWRDIVAIEAVPLRDLAALLEGWAGRAQRPCGLQQKGVRHSSTNARAARRFLEETPRGRKVPAQGVTAGLRRLFITLGAVARGRSRSARPFCTAPAQSTPRHAALVLKWRLRAPRDLDAPGIVSTPSNTHMELPAPTTDAERIRMA